MKVERRSAWAEKIRELREEPIQAVFADGADPPAKLTQWHGAKKCEPDERRLPESCSGKIRVVQADDFVETCHLVL